MWVLYVDATCINYDGNAFDATLLAMVAALKNSTCPVLRRPAILLGYTFPAYSKVAKGSVR